MHLVYVLFIYGLQIQIFNFNVQLNVQQMGTQLTIYLVLHLPLYHSSRTFQFINISPFEECAFVLKSQVALNELEAN
jgi:hypothetical protein